ncbi:NAD-dependent epimerase/dehydratase family protein [Aeromicrobium sp. Marseille-Q0843]|uniref:NAD-dependent epimerase/dehydratase family protein n=1 Tax=Aeromicrobium phoceense TaxID=2754045 RepID=A0A838XM56_9ACTN|nr:NAD-dependent epimerase/dehydratase family protein [Aeromicrobium phoceense]MBA4609858.1 NAD-dependent epimerase/dehydratase family protein [Aeromicrobium phoceense]
MTAHDGLAKDFHGLHAVVTGGSGFLGSHVCESLLARGARVTCWDNESTGAEANIAHLLGHERFTYRLCDVAEPLPAVDRADVVLHLASIASPLAYGRRPIDTLRSGSAGTLQLLELAAKHQARFVVSSTSEVYGDPQVHPQHEDYWGHVNPVGPRAVYDESKRFAEAAVVGARREWDVDAGIVRIFNTYGPRMAVDDGRVVPTFIDQAVRGLPLTVAGDGSQTRSLCYVDDTVEAIVRMASSDVQGPVNVGNPDEYTILELARVIVGLTNSSSPIEHVAKPQDDPSRRKPDIARARAALGWEPTVGLRDGLRRTLGWYLAHSSV